MDSRPFSPRTSSTVSVSSSYAPSSPGPSISLRGRASPSVAGSYKRQRLLSDASTIRNLKPIKPAARPRKDSQPLAANPKDVDCMRLSLADGSDVDSLFVAFSSRDVREIEESARLEAEKKREDLRTMVGERYRDLLSAADSILRMRKSSGLLLKGLSCVHRDCVRESMSEKAQSYQVPRPAHTSAEDISLSSPYTLATLVKLLLDCPEYIWRALEQDDCLSAARLEGLGRIIYREFVSAREKEESDPVLAAFPLVDKHWENLSSLNNQIVKRAKATLQRWDTSAFHTGQNLASLILLENSSLPQILSLFLTRRLSALEEVLSDSQEDTAKYLIQTISLLASTLAQAQTLFSDSQENLLAILDQLQANSAALPTPSQPFNPKNALKPEDLPPILHTVPNMHHLLRYLPHSIISFTPYIDMRQTISSDSLDKEIEEWFKLASSKIIDSLKIKLQAIESASDLAILHRSIIAFPSSSTQISTLQTRLTTTLESRLAAVIQLSLNALLEQFTSSLNTALHSEHQAPAEHLFGSLEPLGNKPAITTAKEAEVLKAHQVPIARFRSVIRKRVDARPDVLDGLLSLMEAEMGRLVLEVKEWMGGDVRAMVADMYASWCEGLKGVLKNVEVASVQENVFLLRMLKALQDDRSFAHALAFVSDTAPTFDFQDMQKRCLEAWRQDAVDRALAAAQIPPLQGKQAQATEGENMADLSASLFQGLHILTGAVQRLGSHLLQRLPPDQGVHLIDSFVSAYCEKLKSSLESQGSNLRQVYFDLMFLSELAADTSALQDSVSQLLEQDPELASSETDIKGGASAQLKRMQNILLPLLPAAKQVPDSTRLLRLGPPPTAASKQVSNGITVAKPGPRFALLPVQQL